MFGSWSGNGWWEWANDLQAIENTVARTNGQRYRSVIATTFNQDRSQPLQNSENFLNLYYDDEGWWGNAWVRAYDLTGNDRYLRMARSIFSDMAGGWDDTCGGGLWWSKDRKYKNAIPNELFLLLATRLHRRTSHDGGPHSYLDWALREWAWFRHSGMINDKHLINDGLDSSCRNNGGITWTYNQGVILAGLTDLYKITGNSSNLTQAESIADAAGTTLVDSHGILQEPCELSLSCGRDGPQFKGIFMQYLAYLYDADHQARFYSFLARNAGAIWNHDRDRHGHLGLVWDGPFDTADPTRQSSAMMALAALAEPETQASPYIRGAGDPSIVHPMGRLTDHLGWQCNPDICPNQGVMLRTPPFSLFPAGSHQVHVHVSANGQSSSPAPIATLGVKDASSGRTIARRLIREDQLTGAGQPENVGLHFVSRRAEPISFELDWLGGQAAPSLVADDLTVGAGQIWDASTVEHEVGRRESQMAWEADPVNDVSSGDLSCTPAIGDLAQRRYTARFELKIDAINLDSVNVASIDVVDAASGQNLASRNIRRSEFHTTLYTAFPLAFSAESGHRYRLETHWVYSRDAPRLTERAIYLQPSPSAE
jgi:predicted alpha-1,6-mannanase (GH76 family)